MEQLFVFHHIAETVCAHQNDVSPFQTVLIKIYLYIRFRTDGARDDILIRMMLCLFRFDASKPDHLFYKRVVFRQLCDPLIDQVKTAVSHIRKIHHMAYDRRHYDRRSHPL